MDIQQLRLLLALAERRNFTEAAYDCAISQSSLSKHLVKVESELGGVRLFDRSTRPISLTKEGEVFLAAARQMVGIYDTMLLSLEEMRDEGRSRLRIGSIPVMGRLGVSAMIKGFRRTLPPSADIEIVDRPSKDLLELLAAKELDAAVLVIPHQHELNDSFTVYRLVSNPLYIIISQKHPKCRLLQSGTMALSGEMVAIPDEKTGMYAACQQACKVLGISERQVRAYRNIEPILELVREQECISLLTSYMVNNYGYTDVLAIPFQPEICSDIVLVTRNEKPTPLLRQFISHAQEWNKQA